jgi:hypothetical protein
MCGFVALSGCDLEHLFITECTCVFKANATQLAAMDNNTVQYNAGLFELASKYNRLTPDFGVGTLAPCAPPHRGHARCRLASAVRSPRCVRV